MSKIPAPRRARLRPHTLLLVVCVLAALLFASPARVAPQQKQKQQDAAVVPSTPPLKRTQSYHESHRLGHGGAVTLYGAPEGSVSIEGWPRSEVDLTADVELRAATEDELARLAAVNRFVVNDDLNHLQIVTVGTHDRKYMKRVGKDFPKKLLAMPWKIDYRLGVPAVTDLEVTAGRGPVRVSGVEGVLRLLAGESDATLVFTGGDVEATIQSGKVNVRLASPSWRGRGANVRLGTGELTVELPPNFNGDVEARILRTGRIENSHPALAPRERTKPTEHTLSARGGAGGTVLTFTVGDGTLRIK